MNKFLRFALALIAVVVSLYLILTLLSVFLVLAAIGLIYIFVMRFFKKPSVSKQHAHGVTIDIEATHKNEDFERKND